MSLFVDQFLNVYNGSGVKVSHIVKILFTWVLYKASFESINGLIDFYIQFLL
jgi:hypothetical protein